MTNAADFGWRSKLELFFSHILVVVLFLFVELVLDLLVDLHFRRCWFLLLLILCLELCNAAFEIPHIFNAGLEDGKFMHFHPFTSWYHVFEDSKLFIHLAPPSSFNDAVRSLAGNLSASSTGGRRLFSL